MELYQATISDFEPIMAFYDDVIARTPEMAVYARWKKGQHPTSEGVRAYIEEGAMYLYRENGKIIGATAVTMYQGDDYHAIEWSQKVDDNEAAVIHILAVSPECQGKGIGSEMIRAAIALAKKSGMKAVRLDALASNIPAHKIYKSLGFEYRGKQHLYAENTGWTDFYFFEFKQTIMNNMIAFCGLDCAKCDAYIATQNDDDALREKTAKLWSKLNNVEILPEHINCDGCRANDRKTVFCDRLCQIRQCALSKGFATCGDCAEMEKCQKVATVISNNANALDNLNEKLYE